MVAQLAETARRMVFRAKPSRHFPQKIRLCHVGSVMINATGCPAPVLDRNRMHTHTHLSQLIASAIDHDIPTPV